MANEQFQKTAAIACVTFATAWGDKAANLQKMKKFCEQAADQGNDIVIFPELALTGYQCSDEFTKQGCTMHHELAESIPGPATEELAAIAKKRDIYIVFGMPERAKNTNDLYISAPIIAPEGLLGNYRKVHLMGVGATEPKCFQTGDSFPVFKTRFGIVGIQICLDFWSFPEGARIQAMKGAEIILNPTASPSGAGKEEFMVHLTRSRGVENLAYAASANLTAKDRTASFYGHSTIAGRGWRITDIFAEGGAEEGIVSAVLNMALLRRHRAQRSITAETCCIDVLVKELLAIKQMKG